MQHVTCAATFPGHGHLCLMTFRCNPEIVPSVRSTANTVFILQRDACKRLEEEQSDPETLLLQSVPVC
jgi:hypothetical protein